MNPSRLSALADHLLTLVEIWGTTDKPGAKFKVGDMAEIVTIPDGHRFLKYRGHRGKVVAVNFSCDEYGFEYIVEGYPLLIWEDRLREVE